MVMEEVFYLPWIKDGIVIHHKSDSSEAVREEAERETEPKKNKRKKKLGTKNNSECDENKTHVNKEGEKSGRSRNGTGENFLN